MNEKKAVMLYRIICDFFWRIKENVKRALRLLGVINERRCMEKSQAKGIEREDLNIAAKVMKWKRVPVVIYIAVCPHCKGKIQIAFDRAAINAYQKLLDEAERQAAKLPPPGPASGIAA